MKNINTVILCIVICVMRSLDAAQMNVENKQLVSKVQQYQERNTIRRVDREFIAAVAQNDTQTLGRLFNLQGDERPNVNIRFQMMFDATQITPLFLAAYHHHPVVVNLLLKHGALVNQKDSEGKSPFLWATMNLRHADVTNVTNVLEQLKRAGTGIEEINEGLHSLFKDVMEGNRAKLMDDFDAIKYISWLIKNKFPINKKDDQGITPLMQAIYKGTPAVIKTLLYAGNPDLNAEDNKGRTVLDWLELRNDWRGDEVKNILDQYKYWKTIHFGIPQVLEGTMEAISPGSSAAGIVTDIISGYSRPNKEEFDQLVQQMEQRAEELEAKKREEESFSVKSACVIC